MLSTILKVQEKNKTKQNNQPANKLLTIPSVKQWLMNYIV